MHQELQVALAQQVASVHQGREHQEHQEWEHQAHQELELHYLLLLPVLPYKMGTFLAVSLQLETLVFRSSHTSPDVLQHRLQQV